MHQLPVVAGTLVHTLHTRGYTHDVTHVPCRWVGQLTRTRLSPSRPRRCPFRIANRWPTLSTSAPPPWYSVCTHCRHCVHTLCTHCVNTLCAHAVYTLSVYTLCTHTVYTHCKHYRHRRSITLDTVEASRPYHLDLSPLTLFQSHNL
jgi:hypothetical protein